MSTGLYYSSKQAAVDMWTSIGIAGITMWLLIFIFITWNFFGYVHGTWISFTLSTQPIHGLGLLIFSHDPYQSKLLYNHIHRNDCFSTPLHAPVYMRHYRSWFYETTHSHSAPISSFNSTLPMFQGSIWSPFFIISCLSIDTSATSHVQSFSHQTKRSWPSYIMMTSLHVSMFLQLACRPPLMHGLDSEDSKLIWFRAHRCSSVQYWILLRQYPPSTPNRRFGDSNHAWWAGILKTALTREVSQRLNFSHK